MRCPNHKNFDMEYRGIDFDRKNYYCKLCDCEYTIRKSNGKIKEDKIGLFGNKNKKDYNEEKGLAQTLSWMQYLLKKEEVNKMYQDNKLKKDMVSVELGNDLKVKAMKGICTVKTFKDQIELLKECGVDYVGKR